MRLLSVPLVVALLSGCAYISKAEYDSFWDKDGDGWPLDADQDCNDDNDAIYPYAPDIRGDGCDSDCGKESDMDGDDWPDSSDCEPENGDIYPCAEDIPGDSIDSDCDGFDDPRTVECPVLDPDFPEVLEIACGDSSDAGDDTDATDTGADR